MATKTALRKTVRARLKSLGEEELRRQSEAACERLVKHPWYLASQTIGIFLSMPRGEFQTEPILRRAFDDGKRVFCPRVISEPGHMEFFEVESAEAALQLPRSKWNIPEPPVEAKTQAEPSMLDLLLVPAVALDLCRRRCGQGMGFYDRYIVRARARPDSARRLLTVGLGLEQQREAEVPIEAHDELLDGVVFPDAEAFDDSAQEASVANSDPAPAAV
mmetsp:Transcript_48140/g.112578  ORF Transcript_48140/g.112578 Transcript_48140/m.112578 type:complete len:218 (+) Transcript_48140:49-702(+)